MIKGLSVAIVLAISLTILPASVFAADDIPVASKLWSYTFKKDVNWQKMTDAGFLIVSCDDGLFGIEPEKGTVAWQFDDLKKLPEDFFEIIDGTQFAMVTKKGGLMGILTDLVLIDVTNGKEMWTTKELGFTNTFGQFFIVPANGILLYGQQKSGKVLAAFVNPADGKPIWQSDELFKKKQPAQYPIIADKPSSRPSIKGNQIPVYLPDDSFLECMTKAGLRKIDAKTGKVIWTCDLDVDDVPGLRAGFAQMQLTKDGKYVLVPHDKTIDMVQLSDGKKMWEKGPKLLSKVVQMEETAAGLVVRGAKGEKSKPYINVINLADGKSAWKKPFRDLDGASSFAIEGDHIVIYADESIFKIKLADAVAEEVAKKIRFQGSESPNSLEIRKDGYLLTSEQNMALYGFDGKPVWHAYHKAPGTSLLLKIASTAAIMAVNAASAANAYGQAQATGQSQSYTLITSNPYMSKRFKATSKANESVTVLTDVKADGDKGPGLMKVSKETGKDVKCVLLKNKEPKYVTDEIEGRLFYLKDDNIIEAYSF